MFLQQQERLEAEGKIFAEVKNTCINFLPDTGSKKKKKKKRKGFPKFLYSSYIPLQCLYRQSAKRDTVIQQFHTACSMCLVKKLGALMARGRKQKKKKRKKKKREEVLASNGSSELSIVLQFFNIYVTLKASSPSQTSPLISPYYSSLYSN